MRRALNFYKDSYIRLSDVNLSEDAFSTLNSELEDKSKEISDDEPPWMPDDIMPLIYKNVLLFREELGQRWLREIDKEVSEIEGMDIVTANNLFNRTQQAPVYLTKSQVQRVKNRQKSVEVYLNKLKVEWLLEKYRELDTQSQKTFLKAIGIR
jgi:hypothetical protein